MKTLRNYRRTTTILGMVATGLLCGAVSARASPVSKIKMGGFTGTDDKLTRAVSETLFTDLAKSEKITLQSSDDAAAKSDFTLTGSCLFFDNSVVINVRVIDASGNSVPGAAENVEGTRGQVFALIHALSAKLTNRLANGLSFSTQLPSVGAPAIRSAVLNRAANLASNGLQAASLVMDTAAKVDIGAALERRELQRGPYTSVIIDCRGLGLDRDMSPRLRRADGTVIWAGANATPDFAIEEGIVAYAMTMAEAKSCKRTGSNPLIIEAAGRREQPIPTDPILKEEDAEFLLKAAKKDGFMEKFKVIMVIGK